MKQTSADTRRSILDNLVIERVDEDINKETLQGLLIRQKVWKEQDYDKDAWKVLADAVVNAKDCCK